MPQFLSDGWLAAFAELVAGLDHPLSGGSLALGQLVTGAPAGDVGYTVTLGPLEGDGPRVVPGTAGAEVVVVTSYETASALARGAREAGEAVAAGDVKFRGNARRLVECQDLLNLLTTVSEHLAAVTSF